MKIIHPNPAHRNSRKTLAASHSDDFNDIFSKAIFLQNYRIRTDNFAVTLLPYFDKQTDSFAGQFRYKNPTIMTWNR